MKTRKVSLLAVACHALNRMRVAPTEPNKSHVPNARNSHRQLPIPSHAQQPPTADFNLHSCLAEFHLQHQDQISTIASHLQLPHLPQKNSSLTAPESVDWKPQTCLTSPPTITPFRPSRPRTGLRWRMRRTQLSTVRLVKALHSTISQISIADVLKQKIQAPELLNSTTDKLSRCLRSSQRRQEPPHNPERDQRYTLQLLENSAGLVLIRCHRPCCREYQGTTCKDS